MTFFSLHQKFGRISNHSLQTAGVATKFGRKPLFTGISLNLVESTLLSLLELQRILGGFIPISCENTIISAGFFILSEDVLVYDPSCKILSTPLTYRKCSLRQMAKKAPCLTSEILRQDKITIYQNTCSTMNIRLIG